MPRQRRYHVPGDMYHVIARGNHQQDIFTQESDYQAYLFYLEKYAAECSVVIHAFALMSNHVHLLVQEGDYPLGTFMKGVQQSYTQYVNKRYEQMGHLFQGRYKAFRVDRDEYLIALVNYIHLNPVRAGLARLPQDYQWSSFRRYYTGGVDGVGPVATEEIMAFIANSRGKDTIEMQSPTLDAVQQPKCISNSVTATVSERSQADVRQLLPLPAILAKVMHQTGISEKQILSGGRSQEIATARWMFIWEAAQAGHSMADLARHLGQSRAAITKVIQTIQADVDSQGPWVIRLAELERC